MRLNLVHRASLPVLVAWALAPSSCPACFQIYLLVQTPQSFGLFLFPPLIQINTLFWEQAHLCVGVCVLHQTPQGATRTHFHTWHLHFTHKGCSIRLTCFWLKSNFDWLHSPKLWKAFVMSCFGYLEMRFDWLHRNCTQKWLKTENIFLCGPLDLLNIQQIKIQCKINKRWNIGETKSNLTACYALESEKYCDVMQILYCYFNMIKLHVWWCHFLFCMISICTNYYYYYIFLSSRKT